MKTSRNIRVLVVEDDYLVQELIRRLLVNNGYTFIGSISDGHEAVDACPMLKPDVILMDIALGEMDGIEATRKIQSTCPTPIVALTAYDSADLINRASSAGVGAYLVKPPNTRDLERSIDIAMARFQDMMALRRWEKELQLSHQQLAEANSRIQSLSELLPQCHGCNKRREDHGFWAHIKLLIQQHSEEPWTRLCSECLSKETQSQTKRI